MKSKNDLEILETKVIRVEMDALIKRLDGLTQNHQVSIARDRLFESRMWLGWHLNELGQENPYPNGENANSTKVDPPADTAS